MSNLNREAVLAGENAVEKTLENFDFGQLAQQVQAQITAASRTRRFGGVAQPFALDGTRIWSKSYPVRRGIDALERFGRFQRVRRAAATNGPPISWRAGRAIIVVADAVCRGIKRRTSPGEGVASGSSCAARWP